VNVFKCIESLLFVTVLLKRIICCCYSEGTDPLQVIMWYLAQYKYACCVNMCTLCCLHNKAVGHVYYYYYFNLFINFAIGILIVIGINFSTDLMEVLLLLQKCALDL